MEFAPDRSSGEPWQVPEQTRTCRVSILERPEQAGGCPLLEECVAVASAPTCVQCLEPARPRPSLGRPRASWRPHHCWGGSTAEAGVSTAPRGLSHREGLVPNALPRSPPTACPYHPAVLLLDAVRGEHGQGEEWAAEARMSSELPLEAARRGQGSPRAERRQEGPGRGRQGRHRRTWARSEGPPAGEVCERDLGVVCAFPRVVSGAGLANPGPLPGGAAKEGARSELG